MTIAEEHGMHTSPLCQNQFILLVTPPMPILRIGCKQSFYLVAMSTTLAQILI